MHRLLTTTAICGVLWLGYNARASEITFTDVSTTYADNAGVVDVPGYGQPWTTPIIFSNATTSITTFCDDLDHVVYVSGGQSLPYHTGLVTVDGLGRPLTEAVSNIMGQIAGVGLRDAAHGDENGAIGAQAALWGVEYGITVTSGVTGIEADITRDYSIVSNGLGWAYGLISDSGAQSQILGSAVPEPSTWGMVMLGFGIMLLVPRRGRRRYVAAAVMSLGLVGEAGAVATAPHGSPPAGHAPPAASSTPGHVAPAPAPAPAPAAPSAPAAASSAASATSSQGHCSDPQSSCWYDRWAAEAQTWQGNLLPGSILVRQ